VINVNSSSGKMVLKRKKS